AAFLTRDKTVFMGRVGLRSDFLLFRFHFDADGPDKTQQLSSHRGDNLRFCFCHVRETFDSYINGAQTTKVYGSGSWATSSPQTVNEPLSLSRSMTWNCTGGVLTQISDENGQSVTTGYGDPYFWRPNSITDQTSAFTNLWYNAQLAFEAYMP